MNVCGLLLIVSIVPYVLDSHSCTDLTFQLNIVRFVLDFTRHCTNISLVCVYFGCHFSVFLSAIQLAL